MNCYAAGYRIAIVVPTFNGQAYIEAMLSSIAAQTLSPDEIIIVDNASTDGTRALVRRACPDASILEQDRNIGFGCASNAGILLARERGAQVVALLNQDILLEPEAIERGVEVLASDPQIGYLGLFQLNWAGDELDPVFSDHLPREFWNDVLFGTPRDCYEVPFVPGAAVLLRDHCLQAVNGFEPQFFMYFEDRELCHRVLRAGWKVALASRAKVRHDCGQYRASKTRRWRANWHYSRLLHFLLTDARPLWRSLTVASRPLVPSWSWRDAGYRAYALLRCLKSLRRIAWRRKSANSPDVRQG